ncbi:hypothetical protein REH65_08310 [Saccharopolyspora sp. ID03-671]|uniref:hypothetical protein n=1 Tax=Saccharopolyspora sp. ID03-671 TaxID=3073066 RepID=UPI00324EF104
MRFSAGEITGPVDDHSKLLGNCDVSGAADAGPASSTEPSAATVITTTGRER